MELETQPLQMELDTGAAVSLMSKQIYRTMFPDTPLQETKTTLKIYSREPLRVVGQRDVLVVIAGQTAKLTLTVAGNGLLCLVAIGYGLSVLTGKGSAR